MTQIISGEKAGLWTAKRVRGSWNPESAVSIGLERDGDIQAGVIYEHWNRASVVCHIAIHGPITPSYIAAIFHYPFEVLEVQKIIAPIAEDNSESRSLVEKMGFHEEARIEDGHPEGDLIFYTIRREACRFLEPKYQRKVKVN